MLEPFIIEVHIAKNMASLKSGSTEVSIDFYGRDNCDDIVYSFQLKWKGSNVVNPEILRDKYRSGIFTSTECIPEYSHLLNFFEQVCTTGESSSYETLEPPIVYIDCKTWSERKDYTLAKWRSDSNRNNETYINALAEFWSQHVEITFGLGSDFFEDEESGGCLKITVSSNLAALKKFTSELREEYSEFLRPCT